MPEEKPKAGAVADPAANNTDVAQKLAAQDIAGQNMAPSVDANSGDELDKLAKAAEEAAKKKTDDAPPVVEKKSDGTPPEKTPEEVAKEKEATDAADAERKRAEEMFKDSPTLPANASPKSSEAFTAVKIKAAQEISARDTEIEKLKKENEELTKKLANPVPESLSKELEDHRQWRARLDVEADPKFKEFDKTISSIHEFVYAQLKRSPAITDETIAEIKKYGGPENINMEKIFAAVKDPTMQRLIESKLADVEMAKFNKSQAIESAKKNIGDYITQREKTFSDSAAKHNQETETEFNALLGKLDWFKEKPEGKDDASKKESAAHNEFITTTRKQLQDALRDDSPGMRAVMLVGMAQLFRLQALTPHLKAKLEATEKQLTEANEKLEKFKKASVSHLRDSGAAPGGATMPIKAKLIQPAGDALDALRDQVVAERERASGGR